MRLTKERFRRLTINGALAVAAVLTFSSESSATSTSAMGGRAQNPANETCFANSNGRVTHTCAGTRQWCVAVQQSSTGNKSVRVDLFRPNGGSALCFGVSTNTAGSVISQTPSLQPQNTGLDQFITLGTVNVVSNGGAFVCCDLSQNARINTASI